MSFAALLAAFMMLFGGGAHGAAVSSGSHGHVSPKGINGGQPVG